MSTVLNIDQRSRFIISIVYRVLMIAYATMIFIRFETGKSFLAFFGVTIAYLFIFLLLRKKEGYFSILRLFVDYTYIFFILHDVSIDNFYVCTFLFLPILNSTNHSSKNKSLLLYIIPILYLIFQKSLGFYIIIPFVFFIIINAFAVIRHWYVAFNEQLNNLIDDFFVNEDSVDKPHKIYSRAMEIFNDTRLILFRSEQIVCFKINNSEINLVNGSEFVWNYTFTDEDKFIGSIISSKKSNLSLYHTEVTINSRNRNKNICLTYQIDKENIYCFFIFVSQESNFTLQNSLLPFFHLLTTPFFTRLSKVFESSFKRKKADLLSVIEMEGKLSYVRNAINAMHFMRNKLSPVKNYLLMVDDYEKNVLENKEQLKALIVSERERLRSTIDNLIKKADYILEKSNNPFRFTDLVRHSNKKLYTELRRCLETYFDYVKPFVEWDIFNENYFVKFNDLGLELVLANWLSNMKKYGYGQRIILIETEEFYTIKFENIPSNINDAKYVVEVFNSADKAEILKRQSHGLFEMKDFLDQMNIHYKAYLKGELLNLELRFIKHKA